MAIITIAAKAHTSVFPAIVSAAVTSVTVDGTPVAFVDAGSGIRLAETLSADATVVMTYDETNPRAGAIEHRLLEISNQMTALYALSISNRLTALEAWKAESGAA